MKRWSAFSIVFVLGVSIAALWGALRTSGGEAPRFVLPDLSGKVVRMEDLRGKVVVLNLWATWCPPCVEEMPALEALAKTMAGRDFALLAVNQDEQPELVGPWIEKHGFTLPVLLDARGEVGAALGITGYPETFIVDRNGRIVYKWAGYRNWADPRMVRALEHLMDTGEWRLG